MAGTITGTFRANPRGFGFVTPLEPNAHGDLFIPPNATGRAITGDIVVAKVVREGKRAGQTRCSGKVVEIVERSNNKFVGTLLKRPVVRQAHHPEQSQREGWLVQPDGTGFVEPISVDDVSAKNAREKDKVVVEIISYPTEKHLARGVITEVLGKAGQYESEIQSIIRQYHIPQHFDDGCIMQAYKAATEFNPELLDGRENITGKTIVTIDPPDAKDFDDAISLEKNNKGDWVLGVHIADVSFFVPADSPLDKEAKIRGNSAYLPGRTIPMLPEMLSNGICSLQPEQKRFVKSAYLTYDNDGSVLSRRFANSIMCSTQRLTYQQVDRILKGQTGKTDPKVIELLKNMETLSRSIEKRRTAAGMLHLDLPEIELVMDESGRVVDACRADDSYPHTIIEMFMVEANEAVASLLDRHRVPFMRRIHPEPDMLTMKNLAELVKSLGFRLPRTVDRFALQGLLDAVRNRDSSLAINLVVLRSLEKARYAPQHVGHYALASNHYCHFTSPIRRYADLLVHRALDCCMLNKQDLAEPQDILPEEDLTETGKHITFTEERAEDAENELKAVLILQMLSKRLGEELDCVVTGLTNFGVFVKSKKFGIEGLVQTSDLGPDDWRYDHRTQFILGTHSGQCICLGRPMKVRIISVNVPARQLNVVPTEPLVSGIGGKAKGRGRKQRRRR
jgi:ribonuclease R